MSQFLSEQPVWLAPRSPIQQLSGLKVRIINKGESWMATFRIAEQRPLGSGTAKIAIGVWQSWANTPAEWQTVTSGSTAPAPVAEISQWERWLTEEAATRLKPSPDEFGIDYILDLRE